MAKIKRLQDKGLTILPLTVSDAVLMNDKEQGNLTAYLTRLRADLDFLLSLIGEDSNGDIYLKETADGKARGLYTNGFISARGKDK